MTLTLQVSTNNKKNIANTIYNNYGGLELVYNQLKSSPCVDKISKKEMTSQMNINATDFCLEYLSYFRNVWQFVPIDYQNMVIGEIYNFLTGFRQFRNVSRDIMMKTLTDLGSKYVPENVACQNFRRIIWEPFQEVFNCTSLCFDKAEISIMKIVSILIKCGFEEQCLVTEVQIILRTFIPCFQDCYQ